MKSKSLLGATFDAFSTSSTRRLSAEEFLQFASTSADNIKKSRFVPPKVGDQGFGFFEVETKTRHFEVAGCE